MTGGHLIPEEVQVHVAQREERQRGGHLLVEDEEEHRLGGEDDHRPQALALPFAAALHHQAEDHHHDDERERHDPARDLAVLDDERDADGGDGDPEQDQPEQAGVERLEVRLRTDVREGTAHEEVVQQPEHEAGRAHREGDMPAEGDGDERRGDLRGGRADVDRHVIHGERAVDPGRVALVEARDQVRRIRLEDAAPHRHQRERGEEQRGSIGHREQGVPTCQHHRTQHKGALAAEQLVPDVSTRRWYRVSERGERAEGEVGAVVAVGEPLHHEQHDHRGHAVVAEPLPQLDEEEGDEAEVLRSRGGSRIVAHRLAKLADCGVAATGAP